MKFEKEKWYRYNKYSIKIKFTYHICLGRYVRKSFLKTTKKRIFIFHSFIYDDKMKEYRDVGRMNLSETLLKKGEEGLFIIKMRLATKNEINELVADQL